MYLISVREHVEKTFEQLAKKNPKQLEIIKNKLAEIVENPHRYKPLRKPMQNNRRVHIDKSFVLIYSIDERSKTVIVEEYDHHDSIYRG
jgi:YafQ family addiction module toxin component